jgi:DNA-binding transcriptional LysR family regulator
METLSNLESFVRSAELSSFSAAARRLALTPAAISRNVARLESNLGVRLFQRTTRGLTLTEQGERFLSTVRGGLDTIQSAIADLTTNAGQPAGVLKINAPVGFGIDYLLPLIPAFVSRYPAVMLDWSFDNRPVDMITGGFDVAIGGGFELSPGFVARELARVQIVAVAAPEFVQGKHLPKTPKHLSNFAAVGMRSPKTGKPYEHRMRNAAGKEMSISLDTRMMVNDPEALCKSVLMGMGIGLLPMPHVHRFIESGALIRLLPGWHMDVGPISLYFASQKLLPAKTRVFVDFIVEVFIQNGIARKLSAS